MGSEPDQEVEQDHSIRWRREILEEAGFPDEEADVLAVRDDVDLHKAIELAKAAGPRLAFRILV